MKYDPIMCMMVPDSVKTKDANPVVGKTYEIMGKKFKVVKVEGSNVTVIGENGIVSHFRLDMFNSVKARDELSLAQKKQVVTELNGFLKKSYNFSNESEYARAYEDLRQMFTTGSRKSISGLFKNAVKKTGAHDSASALDKAITTCDKTEFDPQDISYIRKAIGTLKAANSLLGMINEGTVNKAKQNIANTISLLESID